MSKVLFLGILLVLLMGSASSIGLYYFESMGEPNIEEKLFQGPVPLGYDLKYFRETGNTIKEVQLVNS